MNINGHEVTDGVLDLCSSAITVIENKAFLSERSIRSVMIPSGIEHVGDWAFAKCVNLRNVRFAGEHRPGLFGRNVFDGCDALERIGFAGTDPETERLLAVCANKHSRSICRRWQSA